MFFVSTLNNVLVNDGSGKVPAYRGLVDAVRSIVRADGVKGLYQVGFVLKIQCKKLLKLLCSRWQHSERTSIVRKGWIPMSASG